MKKVPQLPVYTRDRQISIERVYTPSTFYRKPVVYKCIYDYKLAWNKYMCTSLITLRGGYYIILYFTPPPSPTHSSILNMANLQMFLSLILSTQLWELSCSTNIKFSQIFFGMPILTVFRNSRRGEGGLKSITAVTRLFMLDMIP